MKTNLFVDMDGVILNSIEAFCETYTYMYQNEKGYIKPNPNNVNTWNFTNECTLIKNNEDVEEIFSDKHFFTVVKPMTNAIESLYKLSDKYNIIICTVGILLNLGYKTKWINSNLPFIKNSILINNEGCKMDKSIINMSGGIFIDDVKSNLDSSNASYKCCFGKIYKWNENWQGNRCFTWFEVEDMLL